MQGPSMLAVECARDEDLLMELRVSECTDDADLADERAESDVDDECALHEGSWVPSSEVMTEDK